MPYLEDNDTTGGPAFPHPLEGSNGMSLRDYFAGQALTGVLTNLASMTPYMRSNVEQFAKDCYIMADAMLKQRAK